MEVDIEGFISEQIPEVRARYYRGIIWYQMITSDVVRSVCYYRRTFYDCTPTIDEDLWVDIKVFDPLINNMPQFKNWAQDHKLEVGDDGDNVAIKLIKTIPDSLMGGNTTEIVKSYLEEFKVKVQAIIDTWEAARIAIILSYLKLAKMKVILRNDHYFLILADRYQIRLYKLDEDLDVDTPFVNFVLTREGRKIGLSVQKDDESFSRNYPHKLFVSHIVEEIQYDEIYNIVEASGTNSFIANITPYSSTSIEPDNYKGSIEMNILIPEIPRDSRLFKTDYYGRGDVYFVYHEGLFYSKDIVTDGIKTTNEYDFEYLEEIYRNETYNGEIYDFSEERKENVDEVLDLISKLRIPYLREYCTDFVLIKKLCEAKLFNMRFLLRENSIPMSQEPYQQLIVDVIDDDYNYDPKTAEGIIERVDRNIGAYRPNEANGLNTLNMIKDMIKKALDSGNSLFANELSSSLMKFD